MASYLSRTSARTRRGILSFKQLLVLGLALSLLLLLFRIILLLLSLSLLLSLLLVCLFLVVVVIVVVVVVVVLLLLLLLVVLFCILPLDKGLARRAQVRDGGHDHRLAAGGRPRAQRMLYY